MFRKVLIANRGEIAVRVIRACRELGISPVAVYSEADHDALHVQLADQALSIGPPPARESYLKIDAVVGAALDCGAEAIHPGYGFLSERPDFARAVEEAGLVFVGPTPESIELAGDKMQARQVAAAAGVPVLPAVENVSADSAAAREATESIGLPLLVKAAAGGGGKGMRVVRAANELADALAGAAREAEAAFGDGRVFLERFLKRPRHVEVQILGDSEGHLVHLGERECSLQRRHQKIVEEAPSAAVDGALRDRLTTAALAAGRALEYRNAGTVEFLLAPDGEFYFLEINPRLQVEHPVTEAVTGIDLVEQQLRIASGEPLSIRQDDVELRGHAIECRLYAEDPANGFLPSTGTVTGIAMPNAPGLRIDSALWSGGHIPMEYDPLLAKIIAEGPTRERARRRLLGALDEVRILGPANNLPFLRALVASAEFRDASIDTELVDRRGAELLPEPRFRETAALIAAMLLSEGSGSEASAGAPRTPGPWETLGTWRTGSS